MTGSVWRAWWDFRHHDDGSMTCIVQTSHRKDDTDFIAEFTGDERGVAQADALIADLKAGRRDLMKMIREARP